MESLSTVDSPVYVYDMHSFPKTDPQTMEYSIYLLPHDNDLYIRASISLARFLIKELSIKIGVLLGSTLNDITLEAINTIPNVIPFIIETSEELESNKMELCMQKIVEWTLLNNKRENTLFPREI